MNINNIIKHCPEYKEDVYVGNRCEVDECECPINRVFVLVNSPSLSLCRTHGYEYSLQAKKVKENE